MWRWWWWWSVTSHWPHFIQYVIFVQLLAFGVSLHWSSACDSGKKLKLLSSSLLNLHKSPSKQCYHPHFIDGQTDSQVSRNQTDIKWQNYCSPNQPSSTTFRKFSISLQPWIRFSFNGLFYLFHLNSCERKCHSTRLNENPLVQSGNQEAGLQADWGLAPGNQRLGTPSPVLKMYLLPTASTVGALFKDTGFGRWCGAETTWTEYGLMTPTEPR